MFLVFPVVIPAAFKAFKSFIIVNNVDEFEYNTYVAYVCYKDIDECNDKTTNSSQGYKPFPVPLGQ